MCQSPVCNTFSVALLAEGVDRNLEVRLFGVFELVALLAEGVDRNIVATFDGLRVYVALLAEGVDRNRDRFCRRLPCEVSPSSRRAWIEIL